MKSTAQTAYEKVRARLLRAPGMVEESERRLLFKAAYGCQSLPIVEFGTFFGASSLALASGIAERKTNKNQLICIDAFEVDKSHPFHKHVMMYSKHSKTDHLLNSEGGKTNWEKIFRSVVGEDLLQRIQIEKMVIGSDSHIECMPEIIGLLHLDLPKDAKTITPILQSAFPRLKKGSIIVFQDYAYQFSNQLIAFFELSCEMKILKARNIAASSMFFELTSESPTGQEWMNILGKSCELEEALVQKAVQTYDTIPARRNQEMIQMHGARIRAAISNQTRGTIEQRNLITDAIEKMIKLDTKAASTAVGTLISEGQINPHE